MSEIFELGGQRFEIRPLKLGQLRHLLDALEEMTGTSGGGLIEAAAKVVAAGLQPAHPGLGRRNGARPGSRHRRVERGRRCDPAHCRPAPEGTGNGGRAAGGEPGAGLREQLGAVYGALATGCGYPYPLIDRMTLAETGEIFQHWEQNPPAHLILQTIARLLGWSPASVADQPNSDELLAAPPPGLAVVAAGGIGMPAPVLDADALRARNLAIAVHAARLMPPP